jgi:hypothetical protein
MRVMKINKDKTFPKMKSSQTVQKTKWYPKVKKIDKTFLGCVECSTNGDLLGKSKIFVPTLGSADAKAG